MADSHFKMRRSEASFSQARRRLSQTAHLLEKDGRYQFLYEDVGRVKLVGIWKMRTVVVDGRGHLGI